MEEKNKKTKKKTKTVRGWSGNQFACVLFSLNFNQLFAE
jgi:hypothetical protein